MKDGWEWKRLGDLCRIEHGFAFKGEEMAEANDGPIVVNIGNFVYSGGFRFESTRIQRYRGDYPKRFELTPGEVLLVMTCQTPGGEILGIPGRIPDDGRMYLHNQRLGRVRITSNSHVDPGFVYYLALSRPFNRHLASSATGSKILHTSPSRIEDYSFSCPPLSIQRRIGAVLGAYDDLIENNARRIRVLEEMAGLRFRQLDGADDAVRIADGADAKSTGARKTASLAELSEYINRGIAPKYSTDGMIVLNQRCIRGGRISFEASRVQSRPVPPERMIRYGDVLICSTGTGTLGRVGAVLRMHPPCSVDTHVTIVRPKRHVDPYWFAYVLRRLEPYFQTQGVGSTNQTELTRDRVASVRVVVPDEQTIGGFRRFVEPVEGLVEALHEKNRVLRETRDLLLPRLISGELSVTAAEASVP